MTSKQEKAIERMCDKFIKHVKKDVTWNSWAKDASRTRQLESIEKIMKKSVLKEKPEALNYAIEYVALHW